MIDIDRGQFYSVDWNLAEWVGARYTKRESDCRLGVALPKATTLFTTLLIGVRRVEADDIFTDPDLRSIIAKMQLVRVTREGTGSTRAFMGQSSLSCEGLFGGCLAGANRIGESEFKLAMPSCCQARQSTRLVWFGFGRLNASVHSRRRLAEAWLETGSARNSTPSRLEGVAASMAVHVWRKVPSARNQPDQPRRVCKEEFHRR